MDRVFELTRETLQVDGVDLEAAVIRRDGPQTPILFLHGFGSTKEDYVDIINQRSFEGRPFLC